MKVEELKRALADLPDEMEVAICTAHMYHLLEKIEIQAVAPISVPKVFQPVVVADANERKEMLILGRW